MDAEGGGTGVPTCFRHPTRETYISCQRCGRPICPDCMTDAVVGHQCPDCIAEGARRTRQHEGPYGGRTSANPALTSWVLIAMNLAVWLGIMLTGGDRSRWEYVLSLSPRGTCFSSDFTGYVPGATEAMCRTGGGALTWVNGVADGAVWQVMSSAFTHVAIIHIAFNMLALWFLGPGLESVLGRVRFLAVYLVSALAGSAAVMAFSNPATHTLGASGAVFGMLGALLVVTRKVRGDYQQVLMWIGLNFVITFMTPSISWQGHLGGFLGGIAVTSALVYAPRERRALAQWGAVALVVLVSVGVIAARAVALN